MASNSITITQRQTPTFRALIKSSSGEFFDVSKHLATKAQLEEEGVQYPPISYSLYKSSSELTPYDFSTDEAEIVPGYADIEIEGSAFIEPGTATDGELAYNFQYTPDSRLLFPFDETGYYFADFTIYPKTGAAIVFRIGVLVK